MSQLESSYSRRSPPTSLSQYSNRLVATSSIDIDNIAISNNQPTNMQMQSVSLSDATQRENNTDSNIDISESQSIDINFNKH
jgi:hypothetical protein